MPSLFRLLPGAQSSFPVRHQSRSRHSVDEHARRVKLRACSEFRGGVVERVFVVPVSTPARKAKAAQAVGGTLN